MKKSARKKKSIPKKQTILDRLPKDQGEFLELILRMTEKHINPKETDQFMAKQADRIRTELEVWRKFNK